MSADRLAAGKSADRLIDHCLEDRSSKVFSGRTFVDQRLDIRLCKHAAARSDRIDRLIILRVFIQTTGIRLDQRCHLINKRTRTTGTDTIHTLFNISIFKVNDLRIFTAKLDRYICLRCDMFKRSRNGNHFLYKRNLQMICQCQTAGTCDHRAEHDIPCLIKCFLKESRQ